MLPADAELVNYPVALAFTQFQASSLTRFWLSRGVGGHRNQSYSRDRRHEQVTDEHQGKGLRPDGLEHLPNQPRQNHAADVAPDKEPADDPAGDRHEAHGHGNDGRQDGSG